MTRTKILIFLLLISSFFGYLEWSGDNHTYLFQAEADILLKLFTDPASVLHPFIILPLLGQIILSIAFFQKKPKNPDLYWYSRFECFVWIYSFYWIVESSKLIDFTHA